MKSILISTFIALIFTSCGGSKPTSKTTKNVLSASADIAKQCGCTTDYKPVCAAYTSGKKQTFENECLANCFSTTFEHNMRCEADQQESQPVCYGTETLPETEAFKKDYGRSDRNYQVLKYGSCSQVTM